MLILDWEGFISECIPHRGGGYFRNLVFTEPLHETWFHARSSSEWLIINLIIMLIELRIHVAWTNHTTHSLWSSWKKNQRHVTSSMFPLPPFPEIIRRYQANRPLVFPLSGSLLASFPVSSLTSLLSHTFLRGELEGVPGKIWQYFPWSAPTLLSPSSQAKLGLLVHRLANFPDINVHLSWAMRLSLI